MSVIIGREEELGWEKPSKLKPMFMKQMKLYLFFQALVFLIQCTIQFLILIYINGHDFLGCTKDGLEWIYLRIEGSMFLLLHMSCICVQALMIEKVFYGVPNQMGYFLKPKIEHNFDDLELLDTKNSQKDDNF